MIRSFLESLAVKTTKYRHLFILFFKLTPYSDLPMILNIQSRKKHHLLHERPHTEQGPVIPNQIKIMRSCSMFMGRALFGCLGRNKKGE